METKILLGKVGNYTIKQMEQNQYKTNQSYHFIILLISYLKVMENQTKERQS